MHIRLTDPLTLIRKGKTYNFVAGDVIQSGKFPGVERLIKEQKRKGHVEKNGPQPDA